MSGPPVSVILPTYNRERLLATAIDSVLAQTFRDFELVIVDDGSSDGTEALVRRYQDTDARVRYLPREHRGICAAINTGIRAARGRYIARVDSDDVWLPGLLATEVSILEARPEIGLVYSKGRWTTSDLAPLPGTIGHAPHFPGETLRSMLWDDATCNITVVVRRECFDRAGFFDETLVTSADWDMWLRVAVHYEFVFVDRVLVHIRDHDGRSTSARGPSFASVLVSRAKVLDNFFSRGDLAPGIASMRPMAYRNLYLYQANIWFGAGDWRHGLQAFARAIQVGGNPAAAAARIAWFRIAVPILSRTAAGRNFLRWDSNRRLHARAVAPDPSVGGAAGR